MSKILFIIDDLGRGGAEKITVDVANYLSENNHSVTLAVLNSSKNTLSLLSTIKYIDLNINKEFAYGKLWKNKKLTKKEKENLDRKINYNTYDLIILGYHNGYYLYDYLNQKNKIWHWIHGELLEFRPSSNYFKHLKEHFRQFRNKRKFYHLFQEKNLITVNRDLENKYRNLLPEAQIKCIANGVDIHKFIDYSQPVTKKWDVIFVGRLTKIKQVEHALYAFKHSQLKGRMAIVGDGSERIALERYAETLGINDRLDFLGWQSNPYPFISASRTLVISSYYESFGLVLAESLMLDVPIVAYNCSLGIQDIFSLQEDMKKFLVDPQNKILLAKKLYECVNQPYEINIQTKYQLSLEKTGKAFATLV